MMVPILSYSSDLWTKRSTFTLSISLCYLCSLDVPSPFWSLRHFFLPGMSQPFDHPITTASDLEWVATVVDSLLMLVAFKAILKAAPKGLFETLGTAVTSLPPIHLGHQRLLHILRSAKHKIQKTVSKRGRGSQRIVRRRAVIQAMGEENIRSACSFKK